MNLALLLLSVEEPAITDRELRLFTEPVSKAARAAENGNGSAWIIALVAALIVLGLIAYRQGLLSRFPGKSEDRALRAMARNAHLRRGQVSLLRTLAGALGAPAVALAMSERAFDQAVTAAEQTGKASASATERAAVLELRYRLFSPK